jgi:sigma-B regulation protein RsbQ
MSTVDTSSSHQQLVFVRNNVQVRGHGPSTLVFAHGFGCDQNMWRFVAPAFEAGHRVVLFDYVGCGRSDLGAFDPARYATLDGYARDVVEVCEALGLREATFVGHSVSSMIGVLAALRQPSLFGRMVMVGPSPRYINDAPDYFGGFEREDIEGLLSVMDHNYIGWAGALAPMVMGNPDQPQLTQELQESFCSTDPKAAKVFARATFFADNRQDVERIDLPTLILQVKDDAIAPMAVGRFLHERMPRSELHVLDATGHCPHMSHPRETTAAIRRFVEG